MQPLSQVIRDAQNNDEQSLEFLVNHYRNLVRRECERYGLNGQADLSGSDLSQEVMMQVWMKLYQFRGGDSEEHTAQAFECWLKKTARSVLSNLYRSRSAQKRKPSEEMRPYDEAQPNDAAPKESPPTASSIFVRQENIERVRLAMAHLDERSREIVKLHVVDCLSFREIADKVSMNASQVRYAFHKACATMEPWLT